MVNDKVWQFCCMKFWHILQALNTNLLKTYTYTWNIFYISPTIKRIFVTVHWQVTGDFCFRFYIFLGKVFILLITAFKLVSNPVVKMSLDFFLQHSLCIEVLESDSPNLLGSFKLLRLDWFPKSHKAIRNRWSQSLQRPGHPFVSV